jgi:hypothetical protein
VLGEPALVASHHRSDAQREALLAEKRVAAVTGAVAPDLARLREMDDVLVVFVARPAHVALAFGERRAHRVHARHERAIDAEHVVHRAPHARHELHVDDDVGAVGELDADVRDGAADRAHRERHDVHRAPAHAAVEQAIQRLAHLRRRDPVVGGARVVLALAADEGAVLHACDVGRIRQREIARGPLRGIELAQHARGDHFRDELLVLGFAAVAPHDAIGLGQRGHLAHPAEQLRMAHVRRRTHRRGQGGKRFDVIHSVGDSGKEREVLHWIRRHRSLRR